MLRKGSLVNQDNGPTALAHQRRVEKAALTMHEFITDIIQQHRSGQIQTPDLVSMFISTSDLETGLSLSDAEIHDELMTIFMAGHETTGTSLGWVLYNVCTHPEIRERLTEEVSRVLGDRIPGVEDLGQLPYNRMVIEETLRLYPAIWAFPRDAVEDDEIGGYHIPAGSTVFISPYATHRFAEYWEEPETFDPERFSLQRAANRHRFAYFPFGGGPRLCIGNNLALLEMQLAQVMITQFCRLDLVDSELFKFGYAPSLLSLHPLQGFLARVNIK